MLSKIKVVRDALVPIGPKVYHYYADSPQGNYIVWTEDNQGEVLHGDGGLEEQGIQGTIDYFTQDEYDETADKIQEALLKAKIPFAITSIQEEESTGYIHYEWVWEVV